MLLPVCLSIIEMNGIEVRKSNFAQALLIGIASECFIGGMGTPAGSAANPVTQQILFQNCGISLSFMEWSAVGIPCVLLLIPCLYFSLTTFLPCEISKVAGIDVMRREYAGLGPLSGKEKLFLLIFGLTIIGWFTDRLHNLPVHLISLACVAVFSLPQIAVFDWRKVSPASTGKPSCLWAEPRHSAPYSRRRAWLPGLPRNGFLPWEVFRCCFFSCAWCSS